MKVACILIDAKPAIMVDAGHQRYQGVLRLCTTNAN